MATLTLSNRGDYTSEQFQQTFTNDAGDIVIVRRTVPMPAAMASGDTHSPAANTAAVLTYSAPGAGLANVIGGLAWSYDADPTGGNLKITDDGTTIFEIDITNKGPGYIPFVVPKKGTANKAVVVTLAAGGAAVNGIVNSLGHWTE